MNFALSDEQEFLQEAARGALVARQDRRGRPRGARRRRAARPVADRRRGRLARPAGRPRSTAAPASARSTRCSCSPSSAACSPACRCSASCRHVPARPRRAPTGTRRSPPATRARPTCRPGRRATSTPAGPSTPQHRLRARRRAADRRRRHGDRRGRVGARRARRRPARRASAARRPRRASWTPRDADRSSRSTALRRDPLARPRALRRRARHRARRRRRPLAALVPRPGAARRRVARRGRERRSRSRSQYAKERFTFGRAIGSYQAIKHELVEVLRRLENARSLHVLRGLGVPGQARGVRARGAAPPARGGPGARLRVARADLRPRRDRRDVGARRAAVLPPRAALAAAARRARPTRPTAWPASCSPGAGGLASRLQARGSPRRATTGRQRAHRRPEPSSQADAKRPPPRRRRAGPVPPSSFTLPVAGRWASRRAGSAGMRGRHRHARAR